MTVRNFAAVIALSVLAMPAFADGAMPDGGGPRYAFSKAGDGFVRLDKQTGEVALCSQHTIGWTCQAAPEDRAVLENEIARLRRENATLKQDLLSRGLPLPAGAMPEPPTASNDETTPRLPSNADLDRAVAFMGRMWNRFVDTINRAQKQVFSKS